MTHSATASSLTRRATLAAALSLAIPGAATAADDRRLRALAANADALFQQRADADRFSGAVLIAFDGQPILRRAYGLANRELNIPCHPDDVFQTGSTAKTFTAIAVLQMVATGALALDAPVTRYLPETPAAWSGVNLAHLLSHESGLAEYSATTNSFRALMRVEREPAEILKLIYDRPLTFAPGSAYRYSNSNFTALALIVERVGGQPFEAAVTGRLLEPLGLSHTGFLHPREIVPHRVAGYMREAETWTNAFYIDPSMLFGAGGMYTTLDDLLAWDAALHGPGGGSGGAGRLLPPALLAQAFHDRGHGYGLGFFVDQVNGHPFVGHAGSIPGFNTDFQRFTEEPLTFITLSNSYPAPLEKITRDLAASYFNRPTGPTVRP